MLNLKERHKVLVFLRRSYRLILCPTQVDTQTWKLRPGMHSRRMAWIGYMNYGLYLAHALYKVLALVYSSLVLTGVPLYQLLIHAMLAAAGVMCAYFYQVMHLRSAHENASFVRMTLTGDLVGG